MNRPMTDLKRVLCNDLEGLLIEEDLDLKGFRLRCHHSQWTSYTIYVADGGYSSYVAIPDVYKGLDCADERPLVERAPLFTAVAKIKAHQIATGVKYSRLKEWDEGAREELCAN